MHFSFVSCFIGHHPSYFDPLSWLHIPRINCDEKIVKWHWEEFLEMNICANRFYSIFWHALQRFKWFPNNTESSFDRCNIIKSTLFRWHHILSKNKIKLKSISEKKIDYLLLCLIYTWKLVTLFSNCSHKIKLICYKIAINSLWQWIFTQV